MRLFTYAVNHNCNCKFRVVRIYHRVNNQAHPTAGNTLVCMVWKNRNMALLAFLFVIVAVLYLTISLPVTKPVFSDDSVTKNRMWFGFLLPVWLTLCLA